tara:strand:+ start:393 stop:2126 length:1734 start_codon:yes stop_codon:yes gene_type:complete
MSDKYILGINFLHSDTSSCIFKNGELIAASEEERFSRIKHTSCFPEKSIKFCLKEAKIDISDLDIITVNSNPFSSLDKKILFTLKNFKRYILAIKSISNIKKKLSIKNLISLNFGKKFKGKIIYLDHHLSHIASSSFFSNFEESVNLSIDGFGDFASAGWGTLINGNLSIDEKILFPHSMGIFYQAITQFLGFKNYGDEYKVMGLSSYGKPIFENELSQVLLNTSSGYELNLDYFIHQNESIIENDEQDQLRYKNLYSDKLINLLGPERPTKSKINQRHMDIAKSAQVTYEKTLFNLLNKLYEKYKIKNLTLSGGCAMNSVANGKILKNTSFEKIYISPNPGDAGGSIGSALLFLNNNKYKIYKDINYAYLGKSYNNDEIEEIIKQKNLKNNFIVKKLTEKELLENVTTEICNSKIVGWFQDKMEWGARALGNRSILADARNPNIKEIINSKIKRRESFRPFAPAILKEHTKDWFETHKEVPYMSEVYKILIDKRGILPGITHVDGTGRLQTVSQTNNPKFYKLIKNFYEKTNIPILLNTSFNENEPIVESPQQAIDCFMRTNMDILILENWMVTRK